MTIDEKHIPSMHNYCDRWCERCPLASRCAAYTTPDVLKNENIDIVENQDKFLEEVLIDFEQMMKLLKQEAESIGMDWDALLEEAKEVEIETPVSLPQHLEIIETTQEYTNITTKWLNNNYQEIVAFTDQVCLKMDLGISNAATTAFVVGNALEVIQWQATIIEAKTNRAIRGIKENLTLDVDLQSDANGTAKVAIRSIEKSMEAWEVIRTAMPESADQLLDQLAILAKAKRLLMEFFPNYKDFVRPGFDTLIESTEPELALKQAVQLPPR